MSLPLPESCPTCNAPLEDDGACDCLEHDDFVDLETRLAVLLTPQRTLRGV